MSSRQKRVLTVVTLAVFAVIALILTSGCTDEAYVQFQSCEQAREAGAPLPLTPDSPGWNPKLDRDKNGLAC